jgi:hypothetical protein
MRGEGRFIPAAKGNIRDALRDDRGMKTYLIAASAASLLVTVTLPVLGGGPVEPINRSGQGIALKGHDPVAYFEQGRPVKGLAQYAYQWMDATWLFASSANRDAFAKDPQKYAPQFGGYCAYAVSEGHTASIDPEAWRIVGGKLYLNYSKGVQKKWEQDVPGRIAAAEKNWPGLHK